MLQVGVTLFFAIQVGKKAVARSVVRANAVLSQIVERWWAQPGVFKQQGVLSELTDGCRSPRSAVRVGWGRLSELHGVCPALLELAECC